MFICQLFCCIQQYTATGIRVLQCVTRYVFSMNDNNTNNNTYNNNYYIEETMLTKHCPNNNLLWLIGCSGLSFRHLLQNNTLPIIVSDPRKC